ncbi:hypothetical protein CDO73_13020 [Saccharibacillus sp. O23]|nr:hypothetical protein CDO73_13020 [Saccharibacillus sp. O23]
MMRLLHILSNLFFLIFGSLAWKVKRFSSKPAKSRRKSLFRASFFGQKKNAGTIGPNVLRMPIGARKKRA